MSLTYPTNSQKINQPLPKSCQAEGIPATDNDVTGASAKCEHLQVVLPSGTLNESLACRRRVYR